MSRLTASNKHRFSIFPQDSKKSPFLGRVLVARFSVNYLRVTPLFLNLSLASMRLKMQFGVVRATGKIANGCNPSFVILVPKNIDPLGFSDYRHISLIGCVYKVISNILANRLAKVIATVIGPNQSNLIEGRQILDGCLIANEIIIMASIEKLKLLLFKVYFEKAFDSVNWNFLLDTMRQMGFDLKGRNWIASCLSSASISILINGSPTKEFKLEKGLRQGDPLSLILFLIVAKALQVSILEACNKGFYKGLFLADNNTNISLLQYADDTLFFGDWSNLNAKHLIHILKCFELSSGLKVNISKSRLVGIGVSSSDVESLVAALGCSHEIIPFIYLGLPVGKRMRYYDGWNMCDIIKAVKTIENIVASFKNSFMVKVVFGSQTSFWKDPWCGDGTRILDIYPRLYALEMFKECRVIDRWSVINGVWCGRWSWHIPPRGRVLGDLTSLISHLGNFTLSSSGHDKWSWTGDVFGTFKVSSLTRTIQNHILGNYAIGRIHKWISCIPRKVNVCVWRASLNRLLTRSNLSARGVNLQSIRCPMCDNEVSDISMGNISTQGCSRINKILQGVLQCVIWVIWKWRNRIVNASPDSVESIKDEDIFFAIQRISKNWISARNKSDAANWNKWIPKPFDLYLPS
ncbi:putative RNA-directed DNA polymerase, eukaryota, reverse transcriptase zinc-binding domain protein [Tanacetum coccineum]